jgi:branched-chain amino acid transport system substrate-binding protein
MADVKAIQKSNPDYVIFHGYINNPVVSKIMKECRAVGLKCTFMGTFYTATKSYLDELGELADGFLVVNPYAYWWNEDIPMIRKIRTYSKKHHPEVKYRSICYMQGFVSGLIFVECFKRADADGELNYGGLVKALQSLKDFDTGGLTAPLTIKFNRFPPARIWRANAHKRIFEPISDWITLRSPAEAYKIEKAPAPPDKPIKAPDISYGDRPY